MRDGKKDVIPYQSVNILLCFSLSNKSIQTKKTNRICFLFPAPDPPSNLSVSVRSGKSAVISLSPPPKGNYSSFKLRVSTEQRTSRISIDILELKFKSLVKNGNSLLQSEFQVI